NQRLRMMTPEAFEIWFEAQVGQRCYAGLDTSSRTALKRRWERNCGSHDYLRWATILRGDIRALASESLATAAGIRRGELTMIAGGPPCQPFSRAGKRETVKHRDGT